MKKSIATLCLVASAFVVTACSTSEFGDRDTAPPYAIDRTVQREQAHKPAPVAVKPAEKVFYEAQTK